MDVSGTFKGFMSHFTDPSWKRLIHLANIGGVLYYWIVSLSVTYINLGTVIPDLFGNTPFWLTLNWWVFMVAVLNMNLNYVMCLLQKSKYTGSGTANTTSDGSVEDKGWGQCIPCKQYLPPRAHHCSVCKRCILKRDHHCFFFGTCIGYRNERYFIIFLLWSSIASLHAAICLFAYLNMNFNSILSLGAYNYLFPIATFKWIIGFTSSFAYLTLTLFYTCLVVGVGSAVFFVSHLKRALSSQTTYEFRHQIKTYDRGVRVNLQDVFGSYWWMAFLLPISFKQTGDGINWNKTKDLKGN